MDTAQSLGAFTSALHFSAHRQEAANVNSQSCSPGVQFCGECCGTWLAHGLPDLGGLFQLKQFHDLIEQSLPH